MRILSAGWLSGALLVLTLHTGWTQDAVELALKASVLDKKLEAAEALDLYLQAEKLQPENVDVLVGIARQYRHLMADTADKAEKQRLCELALVYGEKAAAAGPNDSEAQLSVAITCGKMLKLKSAREQVGVSRRIKESVDRAIKLNPRNDLAWYILGRWHQGYADLSTVRRAMGEMLFGKLPESTNQDAAKCFEKAMEANPKRLMHSIELGITYAKLGKEEEARRLIEKGLAMPSIDKDDPEAKARGREALKSLRESGGAGERLTSAPAGDR
jgi:tetratricopeptide (TPR) repeat protein